MEQGSLLGLIPLAVYIILCFTRFGQIFAVIAGMLVAAAIGHHGIMDIAAAVRGGLGSFLGYIGMIILLGAGLGQVLKRTGVVRHLVFMVTERWNINSQNRAFLVVMSCSVIIVSLLGTMAGGNAILAPILIPIAAAVGVTPNAMAVLLHGAGASGLFLGPFTPPMVALMEFTGLSYPQVLLNAGLPVSIIMWLVTFFWARRVQKASTGKNRYSEEDIAKENADWKPDASVRRATLVFLVTMFTMVGYGIVIEGGSTFVVAIMLVTAALTGVAANLDPVEIIDSICDGAKNFIWLFFFFVLLDPFINFIQETGAFQALAALLEPMVQDGGTVGFIAFSTMVGIFGVPGAAVAQAEVLNKMFLPLVQSLNIPMTLWVAVLLIGSQMTSFAIPEGDMQGQMGLARSSDLKSVLCNGWLIVLCTTMYVIIRAMIMVM
ncbi:GntT/GntP/DsdX family permease [Dethiosulfovibrio salsuginis]|uniref:H+/gluconate symporter n=1 Tax=Dethiosulfovibrio salsuginis TaxID=561720 RepID=A0A1X7L1K5_9BACT|nr:Na+/H+ antiporter NhaC family protein [Dethiosulfovibrio salsuginis]SMG47009.1 H+/gluconate symporter [Dethiosulfovibrio salsuginis]